MVFFHLLKTEFISSRHRIIFSICIHSADHKCSLPSTACNVGSGWVGEDSWNVSIDKFFINLEV